MDNAIPAGSSGDSISTSSLEVWGYLAGWDVYICKEHGVTVYYYDKTKYKVFQGKKVYKTIPSVLKAMENGDENTPPGKV